MKKILVLFACLSILIFGAACSTTEMSDFTPQEDVYLEINEQEPNNQPTEDVIYKEPDYANCQIVIYTVDDPDDEYYCIVESVINEYAINAIHIAIPEDYSEIIFANHLELIEREHIKAVILDQSVPGLIELMSQIKGRFPDILTIISTKHDINGVIGVADMVLSVDVFNMGKKMVEQAQRMGAKAFVYYTYFNRPNIVVFDRELYKNTFKEACLEIGIEYVELEVPDFAKSPYYSTYYEPLIKILGSYNNDVCFFSDLCSMQIYLISTISNIGGYYAQPCHPSLYHGFQYGLGIVSSDENPIGIDFNRQIEEIKSTLTERGSIGHFSTWKISFALISTVAAIEYSTNYCEGNIRGKADLEAMRECFQRAMEIYNSADTGFELTQHPDYPNCFLFTEDYIVLQGNRE